MTRRGQQIHYLFPQLVQYSRTITQKFRHHLLTLMLLHTFMGFSLLLSTKEDHLKKMVTADSGN